MNDFPFHKVISIHGPPRSGTSWLGQIFNSHPEVVYKYQPLFSYRFKDYVKADSTKEIVYKFLKELFEENEDEFVNQLRQRERGAHPEFNKSENSNVLVMKMVRYHGLVEKFINDVDGLKIIGIVRNPCGVINSWFKTPREFKSEWDQMEEWRLAKKKNRGHPEEYFGFEKWKEVCGMFLDLKERYPDRFYLIKYDHLVNDPEYCIEKIFDFVKLEMHQNVKQFIADSHSKEVEDPDTVFRSNDVGDRWRKELNPDIRDSIFEELRGTQYETFLE